MGGGARSMTVTTRNKTGRVCGDHEGCSVRGRFGLSGGDLSGRCGSASETVVVDCVNVFLDFFPVCL